MASHGLADEEVRNAFASIPLINFIHERQQVVHYNLFALENAFPSLAVAKASLVYRVEIVAILCESTSEVSIPASVVAVAMEKSYHSFKIIGEFWVAICLEFD